MLDSALLRRIQQPPAKRPAASHRFSNNCAFTARTFRCSFVTMQPSFALWELNIAAILQWPVAAWQRGLPPPPPRSFPRMWGWNCIRKSQNFGNKLSSVIYKEHFSGNPSNVAASPSRPSYHKVCWQDTSYVLKWSSWVSKQQAFGPWKETAILGEILCKEGAQASGRRWRS